MKKDAEAVGPGNISPRSRTSHAATDAIWSLPENMELMPICAPEEVAGTSPLAIPSFSPREPANADVAALFSGTPPISTSQHTAYHHQQYNQHNQAIAFVNADTGPQVDEIPELRHKEVLRHSEPIGSA